MQVLLQKQRLIVIPQTDEERLEVGAWLARATSHVFAVRDDHPDAVCLVDLGPREVALGEPINVTSRADDPRIALIGNFAATPFVLDGRSYASVESFWQGLKFPCQAERLRIAKLDGHEAKRAGEAAEKSLTIEYEGQTVASGAYAHWQLMHRACWAKFSQCDVAREALLSTGDRPLEHVIGRDSRTIPGVIMAQIWMKIRAKLREQVTGNR